MTKNIIGVIDSGIGGLSILKKLTNILSQENFFYIADLGHGPYGEKKKEYIIERVKKIVEFLINNPDYNLKCLVLACNTSTLYTIDLLKTMYPNLPIIGVQPALELASNESKTKKVGVLATFGTINSSKFIKLKTKLEKEYEFICQPCNNLAKTIDLGDTKEIKILCNKYIKELGELGHKENQIDTIVLGCTHYPLVKDIINEIVGEDIKLIDNSEITALKTKSSIVLEKNNTREIILATTDNSILLEIASEKFLNLKKSLVYLNI